MSCPAGVSRYWDLRAIFRKRGVRPRERAKVTANTTQVAFRGVLPISPPRGKKH